jgi:hypothetical protein
MIRAEMSFYDFFFSLFFLCSSDETAMELNASLTERQVRKQTTAKNNSKVKELNMYKTG